ncbi:MAG: hypothetical protein KAX39_04850 [candidate division Zixibacteria bacterium]|nr:hypothetical protein [candidate division Zixibacteria bacterium]
MLEFIVAVLGYYLLYRSDEKKLKRYRLWLFAGVIMALLITSGDFVHETKESKSKARKFASLQSDFSEIKTQYETIVNQYESLLGVNDSLKTKLAEIESGNQKLTALLEPFITRARSEYPGWSDQEALQKLASEISKMQPKLVFLDHTEPRRDSISNLFHTIYVFRSEPATGLRDVQIRIRFDRRFVTITERKSGAFVEEQGTRITIDPDSTGFYYITGYLKEGNDINIEVISKEPLKILSRSLSPQ